MPRTSPALIPTFPRKRGKERTGACHPLPPQAGEGWGGGLPLAASLVLLLLTGCNSVAMPGWPKPSPETAASAGAWTRPGADAASVAGAYDECLDAANTATRSDYDIDQDIAAGRGSDLQHSDFAGAQLRGAQQTSRDRNQAVLTSCMERKGFTPAK